MWIRRTQFIFRRFCNQKAKLKKRPDWQFCVKHSHKNSLRVFVWMFDTLRKWGQTSHDLKLNIGWLAEVSHSVSLYWLLSQWHSVKQNQLGTIKICVRKLQCILPVILLFFRFSDYWKMFDWFVSQFDGKPAFLPLQLLRIYYLQRNGLRKFNSDRINRCWWGICKPWGQW